jgi:PKD repeat protein
VILVGLVLVGAATVASGANALVVRVHGHFYGVMPSDRTSLRSFERLVPASRASVARGGVRPDVEPGVSGCPQTDNGTVCYQGGPVLHSTDPYLIYWDPSGAGPNPLIPPATVTLLNRYLTDVAADAAETGDTYGVTRQYFDTSGYAGQGQTFNPVNQAILDTDPYPHQDMTNCPTPSGFNGCITDGQIQAELISLISNDGLPTGIGANAPIYFVVTPQTMDVCMDSNDCADPNSPGSFCAYHGSFTDPNTSTTVIYSSIPLVSLAGGPKGCQQDANKKTPELPNGNIDPSGGDTIADNLSHEDNEAITDPLGTGWFDTSINPNTNQTDGSEIADLCEQYAAVSDPTNDLSVNAYQPVLGGDATPVKPASYGTLYDQLINGDPYYTQTVWSNGGGCEAATPTPTLAVGVRQVGQAVVGSVVGFEPSISPSPSAVSSETFDYGDGASSFEPGGTAVFSHSYATAGQYTATLTVIDTLGSSYTVTHTVTVGHLLKAAFRSSPFTLIAGMPVSFNGSSSTDPNSGATITSYSWSFGDGSHGHGVTPSHRYGRAGRYTVTLVVTDSLGFTGTRASTVTVLAARKITKVSVTKSQRQYFLVVSVNEAGKVTVGSKTVTLRGPGKATFKLPSGTRKTKLRLTIVYTPRLGPVVTRTYTATVG